MTRRISKNSLRSRWLKLDTVLSESCPHLFGVLGDEDSFVELRFKMRDDRTVLAVLKRFGPDGGPMVCFGSGYGVTGALMAVDSTVNAGSWKVDKPWGSKDK